MDAKQEKAEAFALRIINLHKYLCNNGGYVMSKQILRSGTSIGANIAEAKFAESRDDMIHKLAISLKEASETKYWLVILFKGGFIGEREYISIAQDCEELIKLLISVIKRLKSVGKGK